MINVSCYCVFVLDLILHSMLSSNESNVNQSLLPAQSTSSTIPTAASSSCSDGEDKTIAVRIEFILFHVFYVVLFY